MFTNQTEGSLGGLGWSYCYLFSSQLLSNRLGTFLVRLKRFWRHCSQHSLQKLVEVSLFVPKKFINIFFWQFLRVNNLYQVWNSDNTLFLQGELSNGALTCLSAIWSTNFASFFLYCNYYKAQSFKLIQKAHYEESQVCIATVGSTSL